MDDLASPLSLWSFGACWLKLYEHIFTVSWPPEGDFLSFFSVEGSWLMVADTDKLIGKLHQYFTAMWRQKKPRALQHFDLTSLLSRTLLPIIAVFKAHVSYLQRVLYTHHFTTYTLNQTLSILDFAKFPSIYGQHSTCTLCREFFFSNAYLLSCLCGFGLWKTLKDISDFSANHKPRAAKVKIDCSNLTVSSNHKKLWWLWVMSMNDGKLLIMTSTVALC